MVIEKTHKVFVRIKERFTTGDVVEIEVWDGYLADGSLAGRDLVCGEPIPKGLRHLLVSNPSSSGSATTTTR